MDQHRRSFMKAAAWTAVSYRAVRGANERVRIGVMGTGGRAQYLTGVAKRVADAEVVALCDVYEPRRLEAKQKLAAQAREYLDYRELLERKDIDAVIIGSPDHWHVPMTIDAVRAGKDAYVEKPVSHTIEEGERLKKVMAESRQIVQVGYQQRSWEHFMQACELIRAGKLGKITLVLACWFQDYLSRIKNPLRVDASKLDWKRFLGAAPVQPFQPMRFRNWRWFWDFGGGHLTDLYSHYCDVIHWAMEADTPLEAQALGTSFAIPEFECPDTISASFRYPREFMVTYYGSLNGALEGGELIFRGSEAMMRLNRDGFAVYPERVLPAEKTHYPEPVVQAQSKADGTLAHMANFLECVKTRKAPNAPVEVGVAAARAAHLGNAALRAAR